MHIDFERSGGVAGIVQRCRIDTAALAREQAREIERLVAAADLPELATQPPVAPSGPDRFQYDLTVREGDDRHRVRVCEGSVPPRLRPLLDRLLAEARRR